MARAQLLFPDVWQTIDWAEGYEPLDPILRKIVPRARPGTASRTAARRTTHEPRMDTAEGPDKK